MLISGKDRLKRRIKKNSIKRLIRIIMNKIFNPNVALLKTGMNYLQLLTVYLLNGLMTF